MDPFSVAENGFISRRMVKSGVAARTDRCSFKLLQRKAVPLPQNTRRIDWTINISQQWSA